jgi:PAS domain S-box-containing protein
MGPIEDMRADVGWPRGGGALGDLLRRWDWAATALGPVGHWPARLRAAVDLALGCAFPMVVLWGPDLAQVYNDGYRAVMGDKHPAGLGQATRECWPEVWHLNAPIYARVRDGETVTLEDSLYPITRHGHPEDAYFTLCYSPLRDEAGDVAGVLVTVFETTAAVRGRAVEAERARLAAALQATQTRLLEEVFRRSPAFLHVLRGPDLVFELANDAYYQLVGHRELLGRPAFEALPEAGGEGFQERLAHVLATGEPFVGHELPVTLARTPGAPPEERLIDLVYLPLPDADGAGARILGYGIDVTDQVGTRRRAEAALRASEARFRLMADAVPQIVWITDPAGRVEFFNKQWTAYTGRAYAPTTAAEVAATAVHPDDAAVTMARFAAARRTGEPFVVEHRIRAAAGDYRWFLVRAEPYRDPETGAIAHWFGASVDIHDRRAAEAERERLLGAERAARAEAEAAVRARDTFLSIAAHELRTPLTALKGMAQLLLRQRSRGTLDPDRLDRTLHALDHAADRLVALTSDLLDVARLRAGQLPLDPRPTDLVALVTAAVGRGRDRAGDDQSLTLEAPADLPPIIADASRVEQVLDNLLDNALKYAPGGGAVTVTVLAEGAGAAVAVRDTGIGLPPGAEEAIFAPFGRAANAAASQLPGLGLGLYICRSIVERHGGWIRAASAGEGRGTTVTVWLPTAGPPGAG